MGQILETKNGKYVGEDGRYYESVVCKKCGKDFFRRIDRNTKTCSKRCRLNTSVALSEHQKQVIAGSLLSDGHISKSKGNSQFSQYCKSGEYIDFLNTELPFMKKGHSRIPYIRSKSLKTFTDLRRIWYPAGKKRVPTSLKLTPTIALHWYLGDGNLDNTKGITLCTDSFSLECISHLINELLGNNIHSYKTSKNRILVPNKSVFEFLKYIGPCPVSYYEYKWDTIVKESYNNRKCKSCGKNFNATVNHNYYCSPKCVAKAYRDRQAK